MPAPNGMAAYVAPPSTGMAAYGAKTGKYAGPIAAANAIGDKPRFVSGNSDAQYDKLPALTPDELNAAIAANILHTSIVGNAVPYAIGGDAEYRRFLSLIRRLQVQRPEIAYPSMLATAALGGAAVGQYGTAAGTTYMDMEGPATTGLFIARGSTDE